MKITGLLSVSKVRIPAVIKPASEPAPTSRAIIAPVPFSSEIHGMSKWFVDIQDATGGTIWSVSAIGRDAQEAWSLAVIEHASKYPVFPNLTPDKITFVHVGSRRKSPSKLAYPSNSPLLPTSFEFEPGKPLALDAYPKSRAVRLPLLTPIRK